MSPCPRGKNNRATDPPRASRRTALLVTVVALIWLALAGRLSQLQCWDRERFAARANRQRSYVETIRARPGEIVDRHGRLLATTITTKSLFVDPARISEPSHVAGALADALQLRPDELLEKISRYRDKRFLWIKRRLSDAELEAIRALDLPPGVIGLRDEYLRCYPQGRLAAHVLGLRNIDGIGRGGIEAAMDEIIRGRDGKRILVRDARGRVIDVGDAAAVPPRHGHTVVLTLDSIVQLYAERELDRIVEDCAPKSACIIVLDPETCELLAMASRPTLDPNHPENAAENAWKNTCVAAVYEPGSTFKPFIVAWALDKGVLHRDEQFDCENGAYRMGRRILHDHHPYGLLSLTDVLVKSSNIAMAKIGERLGNAELYQAAAAFGFGSRTGIELPGELPGLLRPLSQWNSYSTGSIPMGQELAVTPLQLITAHAALANGGTLMSPRLVLRHSDSFVAGAAESSENTSPQVISRVVQPDSAHWLCRGPMLEVVERGTGRRAQVDGYAVFGKTGTAQKADPQTGGISSTLHVSSFVAGAPADDPHALVLVLVDEPSGSQFGGEVAAPAAGRLLKKILIHQGVPMRLAGSPGDDRQ